MTTTDKRNPPKSCPICKVAQDLCVCEEGEELSQALESYASGVEEVPRG